MEQMVDVCPKCWADPCLCSQLDPATKKVTTWQVAVALQSGYWLGRVNCVQ